jgi:hypothetical protein
VEVWCRLSTTDANRCGFIAFVYEREKIFQFFTLRFLVMRLPVLVSRGGLGCQPPAAFVYEREKISQFFTQQLNGDLELCPAGGGCRRFPRAPLARVPSHSSLATKVVGRAQWLRMIGLVY